MEPEAKPVMEMPEKKQRLLMAAVRLILRHGYSATTVDHICQEAGVTKGSFFHYFANKEEVGHAAMDVWMHGWRAIVETARLEEVEDPLDRVERLFDTMACAYSSTEIDAGCVVGTIAQEQALPHEGFRLHAEETFSRWVEHVAGLLADAKEAHPPKVDFDPVEIGWWLQSFVQGSMIMAKARGDRAVIMSNLRHCRAYVTGLFGRTDETQQADQ
jgi:TetR/AcrR family transcriptional repressor of nem operon